jgi:heme-degrading monooxygenase HmoA
MKSWTVCLSLSLSLLACSHAFITSKQQQLQQQQLQQQQQQPQSIYSVMRPTYPSVFFLTKDEGAAGATTSATTSAMNEKGLLKRDRYIATNRFAVRTGKEAKFEQRWATRKSRLAELEGFKYFHLMRRVTLLPPESKDDSSNMQDQKTVVYDGGDSKASKQGNYVSFTIWQRKSDFSAWRKGDAFKEAHGGTSIGAFLSTSKHEIAILMDVERSVGIFSPLHLKTKPIPNFFFVLLGHKIFQWSIRHWYYKDHLDQPFMMDCWYKLYHRQLSPQLLMVGETW